MTYRGGCAPGMRVRRDGVGCRVDCLHRSMVEDYRSARYVWELQLEEATSMYDAEVAEYREQHPPPTFRDWLLARAGEGAER